MLASSFRSALPRLGRRRLHSRATATHAPTRTTAYSLSTVVAAALSAASITYYLSSPSSLVLLDIFSPVPEPPDRSSRFGGEDDFLACVQELQQLLGPDQATTSEGSLLDHGFSPNTYHAPRVPRIVVYAHSTEDVVAIVKSAARHRVPITPWSGGTSLEGHITAPFGGISLDLSRMDKIIKLNIEDADVTVQSGVGWEQLNEFLADEGHDLFFPLDPGSGACVGGMIGTGCSGTNAVRYGTAKGELILNATVVLPSGEVIKTRSRARKSATGFDTTKLFIGAEGTLGIVTEATLRLMPLLPTKVATCAFPSVRAATEAVHEILGTGVPLQCVELCDTTMMEAINGSSTSTYAVADSIFFKFQGSPGIIAEAVKTARAIVPKYGGTDFKMAESDEESRAIWRDRKNAHWAIMALRPQAKSWSTDVCVPVSALPTLVQETQDDLRASGLTGAVLGHVGDGNFHCGILFETAEEYEEVERAVHRMVERAQALDGTCTGEHGVGVGKKAYLEAELGLGTLQLMKTVKDAIDPLGIFNPGKILPDEVEGLKDPFVKLAAKDQQGGVLGWIRDQA